MKPWREFKRHSFLIEQALVRTDVLQMKSVFISNDFGLYIEGNPNRAEFQDYLNWLEEDRL